MKGLPLPITGTGEETRDFTYACGERSRTMGDIVDGLLRAGAFESAVGQEFNLASGVETRIIDLAEWVNELTGNEAGVKYTARRKWDTKDRLASIDKAREIIGYEPNTPFEVGLENTIQWFRDHWDQIEASAHFGPGVSSAVREVVGVVER